MGDITSPKLIIAKGFLFLLAGALAATALLMEHPSLKVAFLLTLAIWCFARFYYFTFYVIEHYVDSSYHFAGLGPFALYMFQRWRQGRGSAEDLTMKISQREPGTENKNRNEDLGMQRSSKTATTKASESNGTGSSAL